jgi:hypothetical protein
MAGRRKLRALVAARGQDRGMNVKEVMSREVRTIRMVDRLDAAARNSETQPRENLAIPNRVINIAQLDDWLRRRGRCGVGYALCHSDLRRN